MKKLLTLVVTAILAVTMVLGLTACGKEKVVEDGATIVVGVTDYKPMDYLEDGKWVGFDAELAEKVFTNLGYKVEFKEIDWDTKIVTLQSGTIDCIWNGMTVTDELLDNLLLSNVYLENQQYGVVKSEKFLEYTGKDVNFLAGKKVGVESGSAAESAIDGKVECELRKLTNQNSAIMEVSAGTCDIAIVDYTMASSLTLNPTSDYFGKLAMVDLGFEKEEFAIAFRKSDSKLCFNVNKQLNALKKDGTIAALALKYGVVNLLAD